MNTSDQDSWRSVRTFVGRNLPAFALGMLLVAGVLWLLPRRVREVVLVDGGQRWAEDAAPPRRTVVWRPAESIAVGDAEPSPDHSLVRPQLADGGLSLYYTLKRPGAEADIYRSRFDGARWLPGEPVAELNSAAGDYGPVLSADGTSLFLYSDRPGGQGGFDLFVATRTAAGWTEPVNLGPAVNSPAHEYDPAIAPDGSRLYFASNRTPQMEKRLAEAAAAGAEPRWNATLRAEVPLQQFDIHWTDFDAAAEAWKAARSLPGINSPTSNEGEPCVSPDGAYLYFTSDRPNRSGTEPNYDIYRVRLAAAGLAGAENLGAGVNTAANEHDPAFSTEGFRILFSSDRDPAGGRRPERYALFASRAAETLDETGWSMAHLVPLLRQVWWLLPLLLLLGFLASLRWYLRERSRRRAPVPVFFLVALAVHVLMLLGAFFVPIEGVSVAERIRQKIEQIVATEVLLESPTGPAAPAAPAFEQVAALPAPESAPVDPSPRQALTDPTMPLPAQQPVADRVPLLTTEQVTERVTMDGPVVVQEVADPRVVRRQQVVEQMMSSVEIEIAPAAVPRTAASESVAQPEAVVAERSVPAQPVSVAAPVAVEVTAAVAPSRPTGDSPITAGMPAVSPTAPTSTARESVPLARAKRPAPPAIDASTPPAIVIVQPTGAAPAPATGPKAVEVAVSRAASGRPAIDVAPAELEPVTPGAGRPRIAAAGGTDFARPEVTKADVRFDGLALPVTRQKVRAASLLYAQNQVGLQQMLRERAADDAQKQQLIEQFGGRAGTLEAIDRGLHWLSLVQWDDGRWELHNYPAGPRGEKYDGMGRAKSPTAATALALLPFLGDGHTQVSGRYSRMVGRGLDWLLKNQKPDGDLYVGPPGEPYMYSHGLATIAICEAFGMTKDEKLERPAQAAVDFIVKAQHGEGGWRYKPGEAGDLSVVGWQLMALKSAQMAGLAVPQPTLNRARGWVEKARKGDGFAYQPGGRVSPAMTAEGLLCMEYLGTRRDAPEIERTVELLMGALPVKASKEPSYYLYYGTQAVFHMQGEPWRRWNEAMSDTVLSSQVSDGPQQGTWNPTDNWEQSGGRIYATSLRLLMLEVYFRHLPLYQVLP